MVLSLKKHTSHAMDAAQLCAHPVLAYEICRQSSTANQGYWSYPALMAAGSPRHLWFTESLRGSLNRFKVAQNASMGALPTKLFSEN
jgi:hypothetical protein